jgi:hypothetical protein
MSPLIDLLRSIPDVVWAGIIASALTLSGVLLSNRSNTKRLRIQLQHDAEEKAKERTAALRREACLRAAEELTRANSHLASLPQSDLTKTNAADGLQGFFAAAARLQLVAEPKTALLVNQLASAYGELFLRLMVRIVPLQKARVDISISDDLYNRAQAQVTRVLAEMSKFNEAARVDEAPFRALQRAFDAHQAQANEYAARRTASWQQFQSLHVEFCKQLMIELRGVGEQQIAVMIEIRRDLGLIAELGAFREQMSTQWKRMAAQLDTTLGILQDG